MDRESFPLNQNSEVAFESAGQWLMSKPPPGVAGRQVPFAGEKGIQYEHKSVYTSANKVIKMDYLKICIYEGITNGSF